MHNGTIYRWNRPVYDVFRGRPHVRVENRVMPAGPTVVDVLANGAFYYGVLRVLAEQDRPLWTQMSFQPPKENFEAGARHGINATQYWPGVGEVPATELVLRRLLPMAHEGLTAWGVDSSVSDRLLGIIERRCIDADERRGVAGADVPQDRRREAAAGPPRLTARDAAPLRRAHAQQRARPHLADGLRLPQLSLVCSSCAQVPSSPR